MRARVFAVAVALASGCSSTPPVDPAPDCTEQDGAPPIDIQCTGLYSDWKSKTLSPDVKEFTPGYELYVDGADKTRWLYLPPGAKIDTKDPDEWKFPPGTKVWKEFRLGGKRIETRLYYKQKSGRWVWGAYQWSADLKQARFLRDGAKDVVGTYEIPDAQGCDKCHKGRTDKILGIETISLGVPGAKGITLQSLKDEGRLSDPPTSATLPIPEDATGKAAAALGWLHVQCGVSCHNRSTASEGNLTTLYLRVNAAQVIAGVKTAELDPVKTTVNVPIDSKQYFSYQSQGFVRVKPSDPNKSLVLALAALRDQKGAMPPFFTHKVDEPGLDIVKAWIAALPP